MTHLIDPDRSTDGDDPNSAPETAAPHPATATVTLADVRHVAALANLQLTPEEEPRMQRDLNAVLQHIAALSQLDTEGVPPMAQVGEFLQQSTPAAGGALRADEPRPSVDRPVIMNEAPETDGRFFKVPKVIER